MLQHNATSPELALKQIVKALRLHEHDEALNVENKGKLAWNGVLKEQLHDQQKRRRSAEDELMMREYLKEGDLISAEVQSIYSSGALSLHTRSLKYGKLGQGTLVQVSPSLIKRCKTHFHNLPCGAMVIIGHNGYIWISPLVSDEEARAALAETESGQRNMSSHSVGATQVVSQESRETIARLRNCILALASRRQLIFDTTIIMTYDMSRKYQVKELTKPEVIEDITASALQLLAGPLQ